MRGATWMLAGLALLLGGVGQAKAVMLYTQPGVNQPGNGYRSDYLTEQHVYDNFHLSATATITQVDWQGNTMHGETSNAFNINFFSDGGGQPGTQLASETVTSFNSSFVGTDGFRDLYDYSAVLPTSVAVSSGASTG